MLLDLSLPIDISEIPNDDPGHALGHVGTHFDVMEGRFPICPSSEHLAQLAA
jgi:hypothetical protein